MLFVESEVDSLKLLTVVILRQYVIAQLMSGIDRDITPDPRPSLVDRHLPNTPQVQRYSEEKVEHMYSTIVKPWNESRKRLSQGENEREQRMKRMITNGTDSTFLSRSAT